MLFQPLIEVVVIVLFGPQHPRQRLPHDHGIFGIELIRCDGLIKSIGLPLAILKNRFETLAQRIALVGQIGPAQGAWSNIAEPQVEHLSASGSHLQRVVGRRLGPPLPRVDAFFLPLNEVVVDPVFRIGSRVGFIK